METEDGDEASLIKAEMLAPTLSFPAWCANLPCLCVGAIMIIERVSSEECALGRQGQAERQQESGGHRLLPAAKLSDRLNCA